MGGTKHINKNTFPYHNVIMYKSHMRRQAKQS